MSLCAACVSVEGGVEVAAPVCAIISRLEENGYKVWLVGDCVRELVLLKSEVSKYEIVTSARPEEIEGLFQKVIRTRGARTLNIVVSPLDNQGYDVSTLRSLEGENNYGEKLEEDFLQRDFTINAMYYNVASKTMIGPKISFEDWSNKVLRIVDEKNSRMGFIQNPDRLFNAIRLASQFGLEIDPSLSAAIVKYRYLIGNMSTDRRFCEITRMITLSDPNNLYHLLHAHRIIEVIIPNYHNNFPANLIPPAEWFARVLSALDPQDDQKTMISFLFSALLYPIAKPLLPFPPRSLQMDQFAAPLGLPNAQRKSLAAIWNSVDLPNTVQVYHRLVYRLRDIIDTVQGL